MKATLSDRLRRHSKSLIVDFKNDLRFSKRLACCRVVNHIATGVFHARRGPLYERQNELLFDIIAKEIRPVLDQYIYIYIYIG